MKKRHAIVLLSVSLVLLLSVFAHAFSDSDLIIYKFVTVEMDGTDPTQPTEITVPKAGAVYRVWRIGSTLPPVSQDVFEQMLASYQTWSIAALDAAYADPAAAMSPPTDETGHTSIRLSPGRYYVREVVLQENGYADATDGVPFVVDMPHVLPDGTEEDVTVFPKFVKSTPPAPEPTGGERFLKTDETGQALAGAVFKLLTRAVDAAGTDAKDKNGNFIYRPVLGGNGQEVLLTSAEDGRFAITDLPYGHYWLIETVSPTGYTLLSEPFAFDVTATSLDDAVIVKIQNSKTTVTVPPDAPKPPGNITIPVTGDVQIFLYFASGLALIIMGWWITRDAARE